MKGTAWQGVFPISRQQLGGAGCAVWARLDYVPMFDYGIPAIWLDYDENDKPVFECEYDYLSRYSLVLPGEKVKHTRPEVCAYYIDDNFKELYRLQTKQRSKTE